MVVCLFVWQKLLAEEQVRPLFGGNMEFTEKLLATGPALLQMHKLASQLDQPGGGAAHGDVLAAKASWFRRYCWSGLVWFGLVWFGFVTGVWVCLVGLVC